MDLPRERGHDRSPWELRDSSGATLLIFSQAIWGFDFNLLKKCYLGVLGQQGDPRRTHPHLLPSRAHFVWMSPSVVIQSIYRHILRVGYCAEPGGTRWARLTKWQPSWSVCFVGTRTTSVSSPNSAVILDVQSILEAHFTVPYSGLGVGMWWQEGIPKEMSFKQVAHGRMVSAQQRGQQSSGWRAQQAKAAACL